MYLKTLEFLACRAFGSLGVLVKFSILNYSISGIFMYIKKTRISGRSNIEVRGLGDVCGVFYIKFLKYDFSYT